MIIANQINDAFAQFDLEGLDPPPKAQTNNMMKPTIGIIAINIVIIQSPVVTTGLLEFVYIAF